jgi:hypothetical protein
MAQITVVAKFDNFYIANGAVTELTEYGFSSQRIQILASSQQEEFRYSPGPGDTGMVVSSLMPGQREAGAALGGWVGGMAGALLGIAVGLSVPGLAPGGLAGLVLALITGGLLGVIIGSLMGGMLGETIGLNIPLEEAERYAEYLREGDALVSVKVESYMIGLLYNILQRYRPNMIYEQSGEIIAT